MKKDFERPARFGFGCAALLCATLSFSAGAAVGQDFPAEARITATRWLMKDCQTGEQSRLSDVLAKYKTQLEPLFLTVLNSGPDSQTLADADSAASKRFEARQALLKSGNGTGLNPADLQAARQITRNQYLATERDDFVVGYKSKAAAALGVVAGEKGKAALRAILQDGNSPLYGTAQEALRRLEGGK
jgi:hypothetical protein